MSDPYKEMQDAYQGMIEVAKKQQALAREAEAVFTGILIGLVVGLPLAIAWVVFFSP